jgi:hypothetical protein
MTTDVDPDDEVSLPRRGATYLDGAIEVFLRIKPVAKPTSKLTFDSQDGSVEFAVPKDAVWGCVNNSRDRHVFAFNAVFGPDATQEDVFNAVARRAVLGALDGYNGTVFAYGQVCLTCASKLEHYRRCRCPVVCWCLCSA